MYYLHKESNGFFTVNNDSHFNGVAGEPFENLGGAFYAGRVWQLETEEAHSEAKEEEWHGFGDDGKFGPLDD